MKPLLTQIGFIRVNTKTVPIPQKGDKKPINELF